MKLSLKEAQSLLQKIKNRFNKVATSSNSPRNLSDYYVSCILRDVSRKLGAVKNLINGGNPPSNSNAAIDDDTTVPVSKKGEVILPKDPVAASIISTRGGIRFFLVMRMKGRVYDIIHHHQGLTDEEKDKLKQALLLMEEVYDRENWNCNTLNIINKIKQL